MRRGKASKETNITDLKEKRVPMGGEVGFKFTKTLVAINIFPLQFSPKHKTKNSMRKQKSHIILIKSNM